MAFRKHAAAVIVLSLFVLSTARYASALVQPRGSDATFDLVTWNVKQFPTNDNATIDTLAILINDLDVDMIAFEEITNVTAFNNLLSQCPGWNGVYSPDNSGLRTALIWRTDRCSVTYLGQLYVDSVYQFPRPPIHLLASAQYGSQFFDSRNNLRNLVSIVPWSDPQILRSKSNPRLLRDGKVIIAAMVIW